MPTRDDATAVAAVLAGQNVAFGLLYDRYAPLVRAVCYDVTHNVAEAQDLAQDVFLRAFQNLATLREPGQFGPWVVGITRLRCREWQRRVGRDRRLRVPIDAAAAAAADPIGADDLQDLREAITSLPETQRLALHVFCLQEQPAEAAQAMLGLSRSGFYKMLEQARSRLRRLLGCAQEGIR